MYAVIIIALASFFSGPLSFNFLEKTKNSLYAHIYKITVTGNTIDCKSSENRRRSKAYFKWDIMPQHKTTFLKLFVGQDGVCLFNISLITRMQSEVHTHTNTNQI